MQPLIKLSEDCKFYPYDNGLGKEEFIIHAPGGRQFRISRLARDILQQLDGATSLQEIAQKLNVRSIAITEEQLNGLVENRYKSLGVFDNYGGDDEDLDKKKARSTRSAFLLHWTFIPKNYVSLLSRGLVFFYNQLIALAGMAAIFAAHYLVYAKYSSHEFLSGASFLWVLILCLISILAHELGHATAVTRYGGKPGDIGFALYLLMPSFYADVSEIWRFPRRQRMVVDLGGVYFQQLIFALFALLGVLIGTPEYFIACRLIDLMALLTLNPIFQFDGYWLLVDYLGLPNLYLLALNYLKYSIKNLFSRKKEIIVLPPMRKHVHIYFLIYTIVCNLFLIAAVWLSIHYLERTFMRFPTVFSAMFQSMIFGLKTQDFALFINRLLSLFFVIAFPATALIGLCRYLSRLVPYVMTKIKLPQNVGVSER